MSEKTTIQIEGMTCASCANTVKKSLQNDGLDHVDVDYLMGEASFLNEATVNLDSAFRNINKLGYHVVAHQNGSNSSSEIHQHTHVHGMTIDRKFTISLIFTLPVFLHMILPWSFLHNPIFQLLLSLPVMIIGWNHFGKSAWASVKTGAPNMDVLIAIGAYAAFVYSLGGILLFNGTPEMHNYLFFETGDTIITLVLLGNLIEHRSVNQTTSAIRELNKLQPDKARVIRLTPDGYEKLVEYNVKDMVPGDVFLVNTGEKIATDGILVWGVAEVDEAMVTGESLPVRKNTGHEVIGGTTVVGGSVKVRVTKTGKDTFLSKTIELVKNAQKAKPAIQKIGDRISAVFVPVVIVIALITFLVTYFMFDSSMQKALMSSIAVLVISCPCAMGLATPTAVMVGLGRAAKQGILVKGGDTLENFSQIKTIVFDKTGTLTTGHFTIKQLIVNEGSGETARIILYSLEKHSTHPIAKSIVNELREYDSKAIAFKSVTEDKGVGINAYDDDGNIYSAGSFQMVKHLVQDYRHNIYILKNNRILAAVDLTDEIKPGVKNIIAELHARNIETVMISGDRKQACDSVAEAIGIQKVYAEQLPAQKLKLIEEFASNSHTAMVGDGINDAPALARATVGISLSEASQVAIQSSQIILVPGNDLRQLIDALTISKHTLSTIRQNLFWALAYNVVAIPIAAMGLLSPMIGALSMAFSDVIVIGNSLRLKTKKIS